MPELIQYTSRGRLEREEALLESPERVARMKRASPGPREAGPSGEEASARPRRCSMPSGGGRGAAQAGDRIVSRSVPPRALLAISSLCGSGGRGAPGHGCRSVSTVLLSFATEGFRRAARAGTAQPRGGGVPPSERAAAPLCAGRRIYSSARAWADSAHRRPLRDPDPPLLALFGKNSSPTSRGPLNTISASRWSRTSDATRIGASFTSPPGPCRDLIRRPDLAAPTPWSSSRRFGNASPTSCRGS